MFSIVAGYAARLAVAHVEAVPGPAGGADQRVSRRKGQHHPAQKECGRGTLSRLCDCAGLIFEHLKKEMVNAKLENT